MEPFEYSVSTSTPVTSAQLLDLDSLASVGPVASPNAEQEACGSEGVQRHSSEPRDAQSNVETAVSHSVPPNMGVTEAPEQSVFEKEGPHWTHVMELAAGELEQVLDDHGYAPEFTPETLRSDTAQAFLDQFGFLVVNMEDRITQEEADGALGEMEAYVKFFSRYLSHFASV